ncbi:MAG: hypothetical protein NTV52_17860 [Acidobacteria bacterium]|nr:hypothetical protein [Acidobacteriota bacterium]
MDTLSLSHHFAAEALCHQPALLRAAVRLLGHAGPAEDVLQDTFLIAWRKFPSFELGTNFRAWLFRILFHCARHHRRRWPSHQPLEPLVAPPTLPDLDLSRALAQLPAPYRQVLQLADLDELSYKEVADLLQIPLGTVMSRLSRARGLLRRYYFPPKRLK